MDQLRRETSYDAVAEAAASIENQALVGKSDVLDHIQNMRIPIRRQLPLIICIGVSRLSVSGAARSARLRAKTAFRIRPLLRFSKLT